MASMSYGTKWLFNISSDVSILGILIPNILTIFLIIQNNKKLKGSRWLVIICTAVIFWIAIIASKYGVGEARSGLYTIYYILVAYVQVKIFGKSLFFYYEDIMVLMAKLTLIMWIIGVLLPPIAEIYRMFPLSNESDYRSMNGYNILYLFCWNDNPSVLIPRNSGFSFEPGRYAIMLVLAILINLYRKGIKFENNPNVIWLLVSLVSTMSTTGFSIVLVLYLYFGIKKFSLKYIFVGLIIFVPSIYAVSKLDFMGEKIKDQVEGVDSSDRQIKELQYNQLHNSAYHASLGRFMAIFFEFQNIQHDPLTGYGPTCQQSYFSRNIASNATLTGGLLKVFGKYGIPLTLFFYYILVKSSIGIARLFGSNKIFALILYFLMSEISYDIFCQTLFISFWFYGAFSETVLNEKKSIDNENKKAIPS